MKSLILLLAISCFGSISLGVMLDAFTASGVVKSFDTKNVTVVCQERTVQIPRDSITEGKLKPGETVKFSLNGQQVSQIFFPQRKTSSAPAGK